MLALLMTLLGILGNLSFMLQMPINQVPMAATGQEQRQTVTFIEWLGACLWHALEASL